MNPRHRRLLIPGLLVALLVVVVVAAVAGRSDAATNDLQIRLSDPRITESSGLAVSATHDDLAYTINDSGNTPLVFAVDLRSGETVGVTRLDASPRDTEALAVVGGTVWVADTGDNAGSRDDIALYAFDEPGRASATVKPTRYPIALPGGPADAEALLADPTSGDLFLVTKSLSGGAVYAVPELDADRTTTVRQVADAMPGLVTDGAFSPDGSRAVLLTYGALWTVDPTSWATGGSQALPTLDQAETVAFVADDAVLVGSEGADSPLYRLTLAPQDDAPATLDTIATSPASAPTAAATVAPAGTEDGPAWWGMAIAGVGVAGLAAVLVPVLRRRR